MFKKEEIQVAFERFIRDSREDFFPDPIRYIDLKQQSIKGELAKDVEKELKKRLLQKRITYSAKQYFDCDVPKNNFVIRHAIVIHPFDNIVYHTIFNRLVRKIEPNLSQARYSYRVKNFDKKEIFGKRPIENWISFKEDIKKFFLNNMDYKFLVSTDIAGFFEYIKITDFKHQMSNLTEQKEEKTIELLNAFIKEFTVSSHSGIPQNYDPSSYFCSAFLDFFDKEIEAQKIKHFRYVDDIKVASKTMKDAKKAIIGIIRSLRKKGLNLSTAKTDIWLKDSDEFMLFVEDFPQIFKEVDTACENKDRQTIEKKLPDLISLAKSIIKNKKFDDRKFRACIWRIVKSYYFKKIKKYNLTSIGNKCLKLIEDLPGKTDTFTNFLVLQKNMKYVQTGLKNILKNSVYPWQDMKIWELLIQSDKIIDSELLAYARKKVRSNDYPEEAKNFASIFLGKHGNYQDKEFLVSLFNNTSSFMTKRCIIIALQEYVERQTFYNKILTSDAEIIIKSLVKYINQKKTIEYVTSNKKIGSDLAFIS